MPEFLLGDSTLVVFPVLHPGPRHNVGLRSRVSRFRHSSRLPFHSSARVIMRPSVRRVILDMTRQRDRSRALTRPEQSGTHRTCGTSKEFGSGTVVSPGYRPLHPGGRRHRWFVQVCRAATRSAVSLAGAGLLVRGDLW